jgi:hypothetical protein
MSCIHPCNFRLHRFRDRGWGEAAFEYRWDSTSGIKADDGTGCPDLEHCVLYELTTYGDNEGNYRDGIFRPPDPPFADWKFRDPTDGRTAPVGHECFPATQGWAWDRHKLGGRLMIPPEFKAYSITAIQRYCFHCDLCGMEATPSGKNAGPHRITRTFAVQRECIIPVFPTWRYFLRKHGHEVWMDINHQGYVADSAGIGFGPP